MHVFKQVFCLTCYMYRISKTTIINILGTLILKPIYVNFVFYVLSYLTISKEIQTLKSVTSKDKLDYVPWK